MNRKKRLRLILLSFLAFPSHAIAQSSENPVGAAPYDSARGVYSYAPLVRQTLPAVVRILAIGPRRSENGQDNGQGEGVLGSGSGAILDPTSGEIVTNNHVVAQATRLLSMILIAVLRSDIR